MDVEQALKEFKKIQLEHERLLNQNKQLLENNRKLSNENTNLKSKLLRMQVNPSELRVLQSKNDKLLLERNTLRKKIRQIERILKE